MMVTKILVPILSLIIGFLIGFFGRNFFLQNPVTQNLTQSPPQTLEIKADQIFSSQTASIRGKIIKMSGNIATVENSQNKTRQDFEVMEGVTIFKDDSNNPYTGTGSSTLKNIQLDKEAFMDLELVGNNYKITLINYLVP